MSHFSWFKVEVGTDRLLLCGIVDDKPLTFQTIATRDNINRYFVKN